MHNHSLSSHIRYLDVVVGLFTLAIVCISLAKWAQEELAWTTVDSLGLGLYLFAACLFLGLRRRIYAWGIPWPLYICSTLIYVAMMVLFRREPMIWTVAGLGMLLFGFVLQSKSLAEPVSKKDIFACLSIVGSIILTVGVLEGTLRRFPHVLPEGARLRVHWRDHHAVWYVPHPYIGHLHQADGHASAMTARPGVEATGDRDLWGFRNRWPWPKQVDILAIGDSFVYSQMVDDDQAWTTLIAREWPETTILNFGLIGAAPQQYLRIYETFGLDLAPKVLLVGLFLGNDLWGAGQFERWLAVGSSGSFPEFGRADSEAGLRGWFVQRVKALYLYALMQDVRDSLRGGRFLAGKTIELAAGERLQLVPSLLAQMAAYTQPDRPEFTLLLGTLERMHALAQAHQTHCLFLFFPSKEEVYLPVLGEPAPDLAAPFLPELEKRSMAYLDLGPHFRQRAAAGEKLFFEVDGHPNAQGYALIAQVVLAHLKEQAQRYGLKNGKRASIGAGS
jgi:hypothetical protein